MCFCWLQIALGLSHPLTVLWTCLTRLLSPGVLPEVSGGLIFPPSECCLFSCCKQVYWYPDGGGLEPGNWAAHEAQHISTIRKMILLHLCVFNNPALVYNVLLLLSTNPGKQVITWCLCGYFRVWSCLLLTGRVFFLGGACSFTLWTCTLCKVEKYPSSFNFSV